MTSFDDNKIKPPPPNVPLQYVNEAAYQSRIDLRILMKQEYEALDDQKKSEFNKIFDAPKSTDHTHPRWD